MWLQKKINKRLIKRAIGSEYVYQIEADERVKRWYTDDEEKASALKSFIQWWVNEMKKEISKKMVE